ncbi:MAG TPA: Hsp33 family molecular chaperone HslO, partial [Allocoleopsis sp.]
PKAARDESLVEKLESRLAALSGFTPLLRAGKTLPQILEEILGDMDLQILPESQLVRFHCGCSFDRVLGALKILGEAELQDMVDKGEEPEVICHFCNEIYTANQEQVITLLQELRADAVSGD